jgi:hypothetical protein
MSLSALLTDPFVFSTLLGGATWLANKLLGKRANTKAAKVATAIATASALCTQYVLTEKNKTAEEVIRACKGHFAIQLAKSGVYEIGPYQHLIDVAISAAVTKWVELHGDPGSLTMPATKKLA